MGKTGQVRYLWVTIWAVIIVGVLYLQWNMLPHSVSTQLESVKEVVTSAVENQNFQEGLGAATTLGSSVLPLALLGIETTIFLVVTIMLISSVGRQRRQTHGGGRIGLGILSLGLWGLLCSYLAFVVTGIVTVIRLAIKMGEALATLAQAPEAFQEITSRITPEVLESADPGQKITAIINDTLAAHGVDQSVSQLWVDVVHIISDAGQLLWIISLVFAGIVVALIFLPLFLWIGGVRVGAKSPLLPGATPGYGQPPQATVARGYPHPTPSYSQPGALMPPPGYGQPPLPQSPYGQIPQNAGYNLPPHAPSYPGLSPAAGGNYSRPLTSSPPPPPPLRPSPTGVGGHGNYAETAYLPAVPDISERKSPDRTTILHANQQRQEPPQPYDPDATEILPAPYRDDYR